MMCVNYMRLQVKCLEDYATKLPRFKTARQGVENLDSYSLFHKLWNFYNARLQAPTTMSWNWAQIEPTRLQYQPANAKVR